MTCGVGEGMLSPLTTRTRAGPSGLISSYFKTFQVSTSAPCSSIGQAALFASMHSMVCPPQILHRWLCKFHDNF